MPDSETIEEAREWAQLLREGIRMTQARRDVVANLLLALVPESHHLWPSDAFCTPGCPANCTGRPDHQAGQPPTPDQIRANRARYGMGPKSDDSGLPADPEGLWPHREPKPVDSGKDGGHDTHS